MTAFNDIDGFDCMPWEERAAVMSKRYGVDFCAKTLRNWCGRLFRLELVSKSNAEKVYWRTEGMEDERTRTVVKTDEDMEGMRQYFDCRQEIHEKIYVALLKSGVDRKTANNAAWNETYKRLWSKYKCCYYSCKALVLSAFSASVEQDTLQEIYELTRELAGAALEQEEG